MHIRMSAYAGILATASRFYALTSLGQQRTSHFEALCSAANMLSITSPLFEAAALGKYDPDDIYEEDTEAPARAARIKKAINEINNICSYIKHLAYKQGLSAKDSQFYKNKLNSLLSIIDDVGSSETKHPTMLNALHNFKNALNAWDASGFERKAPLGEESPYSEQLGGQSPFHMPMSRQDLEPDKDLLAELYE